MTAARASLGLLALVLLTALLAAPALGQTIEQRVELRCDFPGQVVDAGDTATFEITILNRGPTATYNLIHQIYSKSTDWEFAFRDGSQEVYKVLLPEGTSRTVTLEVATPGDAEVGEYRVLVKVGDDSLWLYVKIAETHSGEKGTLAFTVVDKDGGAVKGAAVSAYRGTTLVDRMRTTAEGKISLDLPKGIYRVTIDQAGYRSWEDRDVDIRVGKTTDLGLIALDREMYAAEFVAKSPLKTVMIGSRPIFEFSIRNIGKTDDTYRLGVEGVPDGWYAGYKESAGETGGLSEIFLKAGEEKTLYLEFIPPYGVETGEYNFTSVAHSSTQDYGQNLTLKVRGSLEMQLYSRGYRYELERGSTVSFDVSVTNAGSGGALTNVSTEVSAPQGWRASISPASVASLEPNQRSTFTIQLVPPADIVAGEYKVNVKARSEQAETTDEFRIVVKENSNIAIYGILILGAVVGGLFYVFKKYGRR